MADPLALDRMLANLIGNALKHTPAGGVIWVDWRSQRDRLEVRDSRVGIAQDAQQRILDEFYQVDAQKDHAQSLGLVCSRLLHLNSKCKMRFQLHSNFSTLLNRQKNNTQATCSTSRTMRLCCVLLPARCE
jgi:K+-sensing histidine kinase KdpD